MVQLKYPLKRIEKIKRRRVLIPVWCNWNSSSTFTVTDKMGVLIPVWCNWNCVNSVMDWVWSLVLIPVWCNWNHPDVEIVGHNQCFNSCMVQLKFSHWLHLLSFLAIVLIPVWCNWNAYRSPGWWAQEEVLIPVWCNWNVRLQGDDSWNSRFNSCMVQLKLEPDVKFSSTPSVLIPVWCNWNR